MRVGKEELRKQIEKYVKVSFGKEISEATEFEVYRALGQAIMEDIAEDWYETNKLYSQKKQAYYFSAEFLMGRALGNNLINLGVLDEVKEVLTELGIDYNKVEDAEEGRALGNNLINLGVLDEVKEVLTELGIDYNKVEDAEEDSALGNGGLGILSPCFLDSLATLNLPGHGYGIRYRNGIFNQSFKDGYQVEKPETWLKYGDIWNKI